MTKTITSTLVTTYTYDAANRLATQNEQSSFTWDANGNLLQDGSTTYAYDFANRLISTTLSGVNTQFGYNGDGIRLRLIEAGTLTTYTQDYAAPLPVVLQAKTGSASTQYLYSMGTRPLAEYEAAAWEYLLADPLGSVRQIADASGSVTLLKSYESYGTVLNSQGSATSVFGYSGEQVDSTGLIYLRERYMSPRLGIFLSRDQWPGDVLWPSSLNAWLYVYSNPVNLTDPSGWQCQGPICPEPVPTPVPTPPREPAAPPQPPSTPTLPPPPLPRGPATPPRPPSTPTPPPVARPIEEAPPGARPAHDGYIFGVVGTLAAFPGSGLTSGVWSQTECNTYGTALVGAELVYDFRHQERGLFTYRAAGETVIQVASGSIGTYRGFTSGFTQGVADYRGKAESTGVSFSVTLRKFVDVSGGTWSSVPFNDDGTVNPEGVYATFSGMGLGVGLGSPVSLAISHADYTFVQGTLLDYNGADRYSGTLISVRLGAAQQMAAEIMAAEFLLSTGMGMAGQAIASLYQWVNYR